MIRFYRGGLCTQLNLHTAEVCFVIFDHFLLWYHLKYSHPHPWEPISPMLPVQDLHETAISLLFATKMFLTPAPTPSEEKHSSSSSGICRSYMMTAFITFLRTLTKWLTDVTQWRKGSPGLSWWRRRKGRDGYCGGEGTKGLPAGAVSFTATEAWGEAHSEPADSGNREFSMEVGPD